MVIYKTRWTGHFFEKIFLLRKKGDKTENIELKSLDRRYEGLRFQDRHREEALLTSIMTQGILDPLYVVDSGTTHPVLLDGFKRTRCALKLGLMDVPVMRLAENEAVGILKFLRMSGCRGMNALEEAGLIDELHDRHSLTVTEIARRLDRSVSWVSMRLGLFSEMSESVREKIFSGRFPARSYLYTLRHFTRVKSKRRKEEIEAFVESVSGKGYGTRDIELLAGGYFNGSDLLRAQIRSGNLDWTLRQMKQAAAQKAADALDKEDRTLRDLEIVCGLMSRLSAGLIPAQFGGSDFFIRSRAIVKKLLALLAGFKDSLQEYYDKTGQATGGEGALRGGPG